MKSLDKDVTPERVEGINYPNGSFELITSKGESYFDRCCREFTAALLSNEKIDNIQVNNRVPQMVALAIKTAIELDRQMEIIKHTLKNEKENS